MKALIVNDYKLAMEIAKPKSWGYIIHGVEMYSPVQDGLNTYTEDALYLVDTNKKRLFHAALTHEHVYYGTNKIYDLVLKYVNNYCPRYHDEPYTKIKYFQEPIKRE